MKKINNKRFNLLVKSLIILSTIILIMTSLSILPILIGIIGLLVIPTSFINNQIAKADEEFWIDSFGLTKNTVAQYNLSDITFSKPPVILVLLLIVILIILYIVIIAQVRKWLKNVSNGQIFTYKNANTITFIAYYFLVLGVFESVINLASNFVIYSFLDYNSKLYALVDKNIESVGDFIYDFNFTLIFAGIIIWIISYVFKYGAFLQDEFDHTV
ncbi:DUF2975 domain-containing protein [Staphylococcus xylosus]|uniref:DUF2975 domain-containing protein n=1 Tax=Staphylococcus xylosus TaxID=1288 RepID=UPI002DB7F249|nr:DUF2975 domain-containing protein [Staphylococcus xylosus]MEB6239916.1 DUF2975 domain-containing protein [Staphylococcus xylosus]